MSSTERNIVLRTLDHHQRSGLDGVGRCVCLCGWTSKALDDEPAEPVSRHRLQVAALLGGKVWTTTSPNPAAEVEYRRHLLTVLGSALLDEPTGVTPH